MQVKIDGKGKISQGYQQIRVFGRDNQEIVKKILKHLGLWDLKARPLPKSNAPPQNVHIDYSVSQVPPCDENLYSDPDYPIEVYAS